MKRICANLALCSLIPTNIDAIFVTHQHSDHISGLAMLTKHYPVPVYAPLSVLRHLPTALGIAPELLHAFPIG